MYRHPLRVLTRGRSESFNLTFVFVADEERVFARAALL
jgi:hypothetical protein